jgi:hypothetical protein
VVLALWVDGTKFSSAQTGLNVYDWERWLCSAHQLKEPLHKIQDIQPAAIKAVIATEDDHIR